MCMISEKGGEKEKRRQEGRQEVWKNVTKQWRVRKRFNKNRKNSRNPVIKKDEITPCDGTHQYSG